MAPVQKLLDYVFPLFPKGQSLSLATISITNFLEDRSSVIKKDHEEAAVIAKSFVPWYIDYTNYLVDSILPSNITYQQKKQFFHDLKQYYWDNLIQFLQDFPLMCLWWWDRERHEQLAFLALRRAYGNFQNLCQNFPSLRLLAYHFQGPSHLYHGVWPVPMHWKHFNEGWDAIKSNPRGRNFLCLGNWIHGIVFIFKWEQIHTCCCRLYV